MIIIEEPVGETSRQVFSVCGGAAGYERNTQKNRENF